MSDNVFTTKETMPDEGMIQDTLGFNYSHLEYIRQYIDAEIGVTKEEWKFYGKKLGWTLKKFYKKRNLFFISMYEGYFKISFVFGEKAFNKVLDSSIAETLKKELAEARKYAEGRGLSIKVDDATYLDDIKKFIQIKIDNS